MRRPTVYLVAVMFMAVVLSTGVSAFDNIEADVYYDGPLREQISTEYASMLGALEAQAKSLGVEPRAKDIQEAKRHFATKALMMALCLDTGISIKKMIVKNVDLKKYVSGCVQTQTEFIAWIQLGGKVSDSCRFENMSVTLKHEKPVYDFLKISGMFPEHYDAIAMRECHLKEKRLPETWMPNRQ